MTRKGRKVKLYVSSEIETPEHLEVKRSGDLSLDFDKSAEEYDFRGSDFAYNATGTIKVPLSFKYLRSPKAAAGSGETSLADAVYTALMDSFINSTPLLTSVLDGPIATVGSTGWRGCYEVKKMSLAAPVNGAEAFDVEMVPVEYSYMDGTDRIDVEFEPLTITA